MSSEKEESLIYLRVFLVLGIFGVFVAYRYGILYKAYGMYMISHEAP